MSEVSLEKACDQLGEAVDNGSMGAIVAKHEKMILGYYEDVKEQANKSFRVAQAAAVVGFAVIIFSLIYLLSFDAMNRFSIGNPRFDNVLTISSMSLISGALIEFIAAIAFVLYARGAKQFGAFHICLERTHRYLLAFKIAEEAGVDRDKIMGNLVCIMANAPMISAGDQERSPAAEPGAAAQ
jgi:hypothetical protein